MGTPMQELIYDMAGGMRPGRTLKAVIPGGSSVPIMTAAEVGGLRSATTRASWRRARCSARAA